MNFGKTTSVDKMSFDIKVVSPRDTGINQWCIVTKYFYFVTVLNLFYFI